MAAPTTSILSRLESWVPRRMPPRSMLLYTLYTLGLFLVFLVLTFPYDLVARRAIDRLAADSGWTVGFEQVRLFPWEGYRFSDLRVIPPEKPDEPVVRAQRVSVWPSLSSLLGARRLRASIRAEAYGGEFSGTVERGEVSVVDLSWRDLHLGAYPPLAKLVAGNWEGRLSGELHLAGKGDLRSIEGGGKLALRDAALTQGNVRGFTIPDLHSAQGDCEFEMKGGRLEIRNLKLAGAEIDLEVRGALFLRAPLTDSIVNGTLSVKPIPGANPGVEAFLSLWNRKQPPAGGAYSFTMYGPLSAIKVR